MTETTQDNKVKKETITIECIMCGLVKEIKAGEAPEGRCDHCIKDFGWYFFPGQTKKHMPKYQWAIKYGDHIVVNTAVPVDSNKRIHSVKRGDQYIFQR